MKSLRRYILEESGDLLKRGDVKFTIWLAPDKKANWLEDGQDYQKIEYKHIDKQKGIEIDFLLGYVKQEKTWKYWVGKIGALSYDDDPYCSLDTDSFATAINAALDKTEEFIQKVVDDPDDYVQFYTSL